MLDACIEVNTAYPWFFRILFLVLGAMVGSFLNVCILRIPAGRSVVSPGSHCSCGKPIAWYDNIPVLSWFILRGRARCCGARFSFRYPAIELLTGLLFLACWLHFPAAKAACGMLFMSCLVCATFIDLDHMIIPDGLTIWLTVIGVMLSVAFPALHGEHSGIYVIDALRAGGTSVMGVLVGSGLILWIALIAEAVLKKDAMGFGDVKFMGAIGAFCGWQGAVTAIFGGAIVGSLWFAIALVLKLLRGDKAPVVLKAEDAEGKPVEIGFGAQVPYGPMLAIAAALYFLWLHIYIDNYFAELGLLFRSLQG